MQKVLNQNTMPCHCKLCSRHFGQSWCRPWRKTVTTAWRTTRSVEKTTCLCMMRCDASVSFPDHKTVSSDFWPIWRTLGNHNESYGWFDRIAILNDGWWWMMCTPQQTNASLQCKTPSPKLFRWRKHPTSHGKIASKTPRLCWRQGWNSRNFAFFYSKLLGFSSWFWSSHKMPQHGSWLIDVTRWHWMRHVHLGHLGNLRTFRRKGQVRWKGAGIGGAQSGRCKPPSSWLKRHVTPWLDDYNRWTTFMFMDLFGISWANCCDVSFFRVCQLSVWQCAVWSLRGSAVSNPPQGSADKPLHGSGSSPERSRGWRQTGDISAFNTVQ